MEPIFRRQGDVFEPTVHARGPWDPHAQHGGAPAALIVRAIERLGTGLSLGRLTVEFLGPVPLAPLAVVASAVRPGRRFAVAEATVTPVGARACCLARAVLVRREPVPVPPELLDGMGAGMPPPSAGRASAFPAAGEPEGFHRTGMEIRFVDGDYGEGPADVWFRLARPLVDDEPATPLESLAAAADFGNGVSHTLRFDRWLFVNLDLTVEVTRAPRGTWIALAARTELSEEGTGVARSALYDEQGAVGSAAQTLFVARR